MYWYLFPILYSLNWNCFGMCLIFQGNAKHICPGCAVQNSCGYSKPDPEVVFLAF